MNEYIDQLIAACNAAKEAKPQQTFILRDLSQLTGIQSAIYIIKEINGNTTQTFNEFEKYKKTKQRACAKLNKPSSTMYVGSSTTGLKNRIKQHLGEGHKRTYALHLSEWFKGDYEITIQVYNQSPEVLQIIEDGISYDLKPAFGKTGGNNK